MHAADIDVDIVECQQRKWQRSHFYDIRVLRRKKAFLALAYARRYITHASNLLTGSRKKCIHIEHK